MDVLLLLLVVLSLPVSVPNVSASRQPATLDHCRLPMGGEVNGRGGEERGLDQALRKNTKGEKEGRSSPAICKHTTMDA